MPRQARRKSQSGFYHILLRGIGQQNIFEDDEEEPLIENEIKRSVVHIRMIDFCKMLYEDIKNNIDAWGDWNHNSFTYRVDKEKAEKSINKMKNDINSLLNRLNELIIQQEEHFGENRCFC